MLPNRGVDAWFCGLHGRVELGVGGDGGVPEEGERRAAAVGAVLNKIMNLPVYLKNIYFIRTGML